MTLTNLETRQSRQVTTTDAGSYDFPTISAGTYAVKITPHFALPGANVSNLVLNPDGSVKNLANYTQITTTQNLGRDFDERHIQFDLKIRF